jgi:hypothetical protein
MANDHAIALASLQIKNLTAPQLVKNLRRFEERITAEGVLGHELMGSSTEEKSSSELRPGEVQHLQGDNG